MPSLYLNRYRFTPKVVPTIVTIIGIIILCNLGAWQVRRADEKRHIIAQFTSRQQLVPINLSHLNAMQATLNYLPLKASGRYDNQHQFLLDNKVHNRKVGFEVITPFITRNKQVLLVNRGWIIGNADRKTLPTIEPVNGTQQVVGLLKLSGKGFVLNDKEVPTTQWPRIIQKIDFSKLGKQLGSEVYPFVLRLDKGQAHGYVRDWKPSIMKPQKHIGYAVQWFALAGALFLFYIFINVERRDADNQ